MGHRTIRDMPAFAARRFATFTEQRVGTEWGGRNLFHSKTPGAEDINLMSNDYLGIYRHRNLIRAQCASLRHHGFGLMMSPIYAQMDSEVITEVGQRVANDIGFSQGALAQSGYNANQGIIEILATKDVMVYMDSRAHASMYAGVQTSRARHVPFAHNDMDNLRDCIDQGGQGIVVVDSLYSAMGDMAPLDCLVEIAEESGCVLVVDESHALGVYGDRGEGLVAMHGLSGGVDFVTASLAKAYCNRAGIIAGPGDFRDYFGLQSFPAIFSSMLLPHDVASIEAAHGIVRSADFRRRRLRSITARLRGELHAMGYPVASQGSAIIPLLVGSDIDAAHVRDALVREGVFGALFTPPATPRGASLVRLSLHAGLSNDDVERIVDTCRRLRDELKPAAWVHLVNDRPVTPQH